MNEYLDKLTAKILADLKCGKNYESCARGIVKRIILDTKNAMKKELKEPGKPYGMYIELYAILKMIDAAEPEVEE